MFAHLQKNYSRTDQRQALQLLEDPSEYPGLPHIDKAKPLLQLYVVPSFEPLTSWTVYAVAQSKYRVRRVRWDWSADYNIQLAYMKQQYPTTYGSDADVEGTLIQKGMEELSDLTLPVFNLSNSFGIDGVTFGIRRQTSVGLAEFSWWCTPPQGCEAIAAWYHHFVAALESRLPAHTNFRRDGATHPYATELNPDKVLTTVR